MYTQVAGAVMGGVGDVLNIFGARKAAKDARRVAEENERRAAADRAFIMDLYNQSRGSQGSAILPLYFGTGADSFESKMAGDLRGFYDATTALYGNPAQRLAAYDKTVSSFAPSIAGATKSIDDLYSGRAERDSLATLAPVTEARSKLGRTGREGWLTALAERSNALAAGDRAKGYSGSGGFAQRRLMDTAAGAYQGAAASEAQAALENEMARAAVVEAIRNLQRQNVGVPTQLAQSAVGLQQLPVTALSSEFAARQQPLNWFRIGNQVPYNSIPRTPDQPINPSSNAVILSGTGAALKNFGSNLTGMGGSGDQAFGNIFQSIFGSGNKVGSGTPGYMGVQYPGGD